MSRAANGPAQRTSLAAELIAWQQQHGRHHLPWQGTRDPYRVWLSEIMLQQTQVSTVLAYYAPFLARFPDVAALAAGHQDDVLARWSGLGYYSRARNLHRCAQAVMQQHAGRFPTDSATLATLPGIGRSTAAAIAAFCFGQRCAILDGNVKRVLTRVLGFADDLADARSERTLWALAESLLPPASDPAGIVAYTQGLMDLGATVCTRSKPACDACPLAGRCVALAQGRQADFPLKTRKLKRGQRQHHLLWLNRGDLVWLVQRPDNGVWAGLWAWPEFDDALALDDLVSTWPGEATPLPTIKHVLTHLDWWLTPWRLDLAEPLAPGQLRAIESALPPGRWWPWEQALALGLPAPIRRWMESRSAVLA